MAKNNNYAKIFRENNSQIYNMNVTSRTFILNSNNTMAAGSSKFSNRFGEKKIPKFTVLTLLLRTTVSSA